MAGRERPQAELLVGVGMRMAIYNYKFKCNGVQFETFSSEVLLYFPFSKLH